MEQQKYKHERYMNETIDINDVINISSNVKRKVARRRWAILAKALKSIAPHETNGPWCLLLERRGVAILESHPDTEILRGIRSRGGALNGADYWKSQARKYCDFCKCWIADNKPSVEFHEKGRRHKENVAKRLKFITKKSARDEQQNVKVDQAIAQMEAAGLEAYRRDVENNADLTSVSINKKLADENLAIAVKNNTVWREAKSDSGQVYYWNIATNESVWTAPSEGYMSLKEQENEVSQRQWKQFNKKQILQTRLRIQDETLQKQEEMAAAAREKMKERRVEEMPAVIAAPLLEEGKNDPYGKWSVVQRIEVEEPEPEVKDEENTEENVEEVLVEAEPVKVFKEKTVESLGSESNVQFKKRRFKNNASRNARTRLDDD